MVYKIELVGVWQFTMISIIYEGKPYYQVIPVAAKIGEIKLLLEKKFDILIVRGWFEYARYLSSGGWLPFV